MLTMKELRDKARIRMARYRATAAGQAYLKKYRKTKAAKECQRKFFSSPKGQALRKKHNSSALGKARKDAWRTSAKGRAYKRAYYLAHKKEEHARYIASYRITEKQPCSICGAPKAEKHHKNYDAPLDVVWLCRKHHKEQHKKGTK
jgi:hypothetical protein